MPKLDPYSLPRLKRAEPEEITFAHDDPENPFTIWLVPRLSVPAQCAAEEETERLVERYLTGTPGLRGPAPFPDPDVIPSQRLFRVAARLRYLQKPPNPDDAYDTESLIILSVRQPENFMAAVDWANERGDGNGTEPGE